jgi:hypothetical protein
VSVPAATVLIGVQIAVQIAAAADGRGAVAAAEEVADVDVDRVVAADVAATAVVAGPGTKELKHDAKGRELVCGCFFGAAVFGFGKLGRSRSSRQKGEKRRRLDEFSPRRREPWERPTFGSFRLPTSPRKRGTPRSILVEIKGEPVLGIQ